MDGGNQSGKQSLRCIGGDEIEIRKLNLHEMENEFECSFNADEIPIPRGLFTELEKDLKNAKLLKKE